MLDGVRSEGEGVQTATMASETPWAFTSPRHACVTEFDPLVMCGDDVTPVAIEKPMTHTADGALHPILKQIGVVDTFLRTVTTPCDRIPFRNWTDDEEKMTATWNNAMSQYSRMDTSTGFSDDLSWDTIGMTFDLASKVKDSDIAQSTVVMEAMHFWLLANDRWFRNTDPKRPCNHPEYVFLVYSSHDFRHISTNVEDGISGRISDVPASQQSTKSLARSSRLVEFILFALGESRRRFGNLVPDGMIDDARFVENKLTKNHLLFLSSRRFGRVEIKDLLNIYNDAMKEGHSQYKSYMAKYEFTRIYPQMSPRTRRVVDARTNFIPSLYQHIWFTPTRNIIIRPPDTLNHQERLYSFVWQLGFSCSSYMRRGMLSGVKTLVQTYVKKLPKTSPIRATVKRVREAFSDGKRNPLLECLINPERLRHTYIIYKNRLFHTPPVRIWFQNTPSSWFEGSPIFAPEPTTPESSWGPASRAISCKRMCTILSSPTTEEEAVNRMASISSTWRDQWMRYIESVAPIELDLLTNFSSGSKDVEKRLRRGEPVHTREFQSHERVLCYIRAAMKLTVVSGCEDVTDKDLCNHVTTAFMDDSVHAELRSLFERRIVVSFQLPTPDEATLTECTFDRISSIVHEHGKELMSRFTVASRALDRTLTFIPISTSTSQGQKQWVDVQSSEPPPPGVMKINNAIRIVVNKEMRNSDTRRAVMSLSRTMITDTQRAVLHVIELMCKEAHPGVSKAITTLRKRDFDAELATSRNCTVAEARAERLLVSYSKIAGFCMTETQWDSLFHILAFDPESDNDNVMCTIKRLVAIMRRVVSAHLSFIMTLSRSDVSSGIGAAVARESPDMFMRGQKRHSSSACSSRATQKKRTRR